MSDRKNRIFQHVAKQAKRLANKRIKKPKAKFQDLGLGIGFETGSYKLEQRILFDASLPAMILSEAMHPADSAHLPTSTDVITKPLAPSESSAKADKTADPAQHNVAFSSAFQDAKSTIHASNTNPVLLSVADVTGTNNGKVSISSNPAQGTVSYDANTGHITYTPKPGYVGLDKFLVQVEGSDSVIKSYEVNLSLDKVNSDKSTVDYAALSSLDNQPSSLVFVDQNVDDYQSLLAGIDPNAKVVVLDANKDGVQQILDAVSGYANIQSIHIISHGVDGQIDLGASKLNTESMEGKYANQLQEIGKHLSQDADILVYGCDFGRGDVGTIAATTLANLTQADVATSSDATGAANLGANWNFEKNIGLISSTSIIGSNAQTTWNHVLDTTNVNPVDGNELITYFPQPTTISSGQPGRPGLLDNSSDANGDNLSIISFRYGARDFTPGSSVAFITPGAFIVGTMTINADGSWTFTDNRTNFSNRLDASVTYTVSDGHGGTTQSVIRIISNFPPTVLRDANDFTPEDTSKTGPAGALLRYVDDRDNSGFIIDSFTFGGIKAVAGVPITVSGVGTLAINSNGSYQFTPAANFNGMAPPITYTVTDGIDKTVGNFSFYVQAVNDAPTDLSETVKSNLDGSPLTVTAANGLLANSSDVDGDTLTISAFTVDNVSGTIGTAFNIAGKGSLTINADGSYLFQPLNNYNGSLPNVSYTVSDSHGGQTVSTLFIVGNQSPNEIHDGVSVSEDTGLGDFQIEILSGIRDPDGDTVTVKSFTINGISGSLGTPLVIANVGTFTVSSDGIYKFNLVPNYNGTINLNYVAGDNYGGISNSSYGVIVTPVNDAPTDGSESITVSSGSVFSNENTYLLANSNDVDGDLLKITKINVAGVGDFNAGETIRLPQGVLLIDPNGGYIISINENATGALPLITYFVSDGNGETVNSTFQISIKPPNVTPTDGSENNSFNEDTTLDVNASSGLLANASDADGDTISVVEFSVNGVYGVLSSPFIIDGKGSLTINADGSYKFVPVANYNGTIPTITYSVIDSYNPNRYVTSTLTLNIIPVNDKPVDLSETNRVNEDTTLNVTTNGNLLANSSDVDGDSLSVSGYVVAGQIKAPGSTAILSQGSITIRADGTYTFIPAANFNGSVPVISYTVSDRKGGLTSSTLSLTVIAVNDNPVDGNESFSFNEDTVSTGNVLANSSDVDGDALSVSSFSADGKTSNANGSITLAQGVISIRTDGTYTFTPAANYNGAVPVISYTVIDAKGGSITSTLTLNLIAVNDNPVDANESLSFNEDTISTGNLLANSSDVDGDSLSISSFSVDGKTANANDSIQLAQGIISIRADGSYTFTPAANYNGAVPAISYTVVDSKGGSTVSTLTLNVVAVNDVPVDGSENYSFNEDTVSSGNLLANSSDVDGNTLSISSFSADGKSSNADGSITLAQGVISIRADGNYSFTPAANYNGAVPVISYTVADGKGGSTVSTLTLNIISVNDIPVDGSESISFNEDTVSSGNLLANSSDADGNVLSISTFSVDGKNANADGSIILNQGVLSIHTDGTYTFTPAANFNGSIPVITYTVVDGQGGSVDSTLNLTVLAVNDAPVQAGAITISPSAPNGTQVINILGAYTDVDGDVLSISNVSADHGVVVINGNKTVSYTPTGNFYGNEIINYTVSDGNGGTISGVINFNVASRNTAPIDSSETVNTNEDTAINVNAAEGLLANSSDADGDVLVISGFNVNGQAGVLGQALTLNQGTLTISADGSYNFVPAANFNGAVPVITYTIADGNGGSTQSTLALNVIAVNDNPVDRSETNSLNEDNTLTVASENGLLANSSDVDGDSLAVSNYFINGQSHNVGEIVSLSQGSLIIQADGSYSFTPAANFNGAIPVITYTVSDVQGGSTTSTLALNVIAVNDNPVDGSETNSVNEDTVLDVSAASSLLANSSDVDGDTLTIGSFTVDGQTKNAGSTISFNQGALTIRADGSYTFTPAANFNGAVPVISYTVQDGQGGSTTSTLTLKVIAVNDNPVDASETNSVNEDTTLDVSAVGNLLANASDVDGDTLSISNFTVNGQTKNAGESLNFSQGVLTIRADGTYTFVPTANFNGALPVISYTVSDAHGGSISSTLTLNVIAVNDNPVDGNEVNSLNEDATLNVTTAGNLLANSADIDGDTLAVSSFTVDGQTISADNTINLSQGALTIRADGSYTFIPAANFNDAIPVIAYTVSDGKGGNVSSTLTLNVIAVNDIPVDVSESKSFNEDTTLNVTAAGGLLANASDVDGDTLTISGFKVNGIAGVLGNAFNIAGKGSLTVNADGSYKFIPVQNYNGTVPAITYTVSDGHGGVVDSTLTLSITAVNDNPVDAGETNSVVKNGTITVSANAGLLANSSDVDGDTLQVSGYSIAGISGTKAVGTTVNIPNKGELTINANGSYTFKATNNYSGLMPDITYTVSDAKGGTVTSVLSLSVTALNQAPVAVNDTAKTLEDTPININVLANDRDADGDTLTIKSITAGHGKVIVNANQSITYTPDANYNGTDTLNYTISDGKGGTASAVAVITVQAVNDAPTTAEIGKQYSNAFSKVTFDVSKKFSDVDGDKLTYSATGLPAGLKINASTGVITGNVEYKLLSSNQYTVKITAKDPSGASVTNTFNWEVGFKQVIVLASNYDSNPVNLGVLTIKVTDLDAFADNLDNLTSSLGLQNTIKLVSSDEDTLTYSINLNNFFFVFGVADDPAKQGVVTQANFEFSVTNVAQNEIQTDKLQYASNTAAQLTTDANGNLFKMNGDGQIEVQTSRDFSGPVSIAYLIHNKVDDSIRSAKLNMEISKDSNGDQQIALLSHELENLISLGVQDSKTMVTSKEMQLIQTLRKGFNSTGQEQLAVISADQFKALPFAEQLQRIQHVKQA